MPGRPARGQAMPISPSSPRSPPRSISRTATWRQTAPCRWATATCRGRPSSSGCWAASRPRKCWPASRPTARRMGASPPRSASRSSEEHVMRTFSFVTVDVFTDRRFGGNPLAVFPDAQGLSDGEMQSLAAEFNLSETTFVLPPADPANTARVRIFNRTAEMPFAGHPNVGTGWVLAQEGRDRGGVLLFEEIAGLVEVRADSGGVVTIAAPQPLSLAEEMPADLLAGCVGIDPNEVVVTSHRPVAASVGNPFVIAEVTPAALTRAVP